MFPKIPFDLHHQYTVDRSGDICQLLTRLVTVGVTSQIPSIKVKKKRNRISGKTGQKSGVANDLHLGERGMKEARERGI